MTVVAKVVLHFGGVIRSFQGDSLLAFWPAQTKNQISTATKSAMVTKWMLDKNLSSLFEKYEKLDFGIGVDWGEVFIVRAGISRDANNNDLVYIGDCVNFATRIANHAKGPSHVEISASTYSNLEEDYIYGEKEGRKVNMWKDSSVTYREKEHQTKATTWYWRID